MSWSWQSANKLVDISDSMCKFAGFLSESESFTAFPGA